VCSCAAYRKRSCDWSVWVTKPRGLLVLTYAILKTLLLLLLLSSSSLSSSSSSSIFSNRNSRVEEWVPYANKVLIPQPDLKSVIKALLSFSIIDSSLTFSLLLTPHWHLIYYWLPTDLLSIIQSLLTFQQEAMKYISLKTGREMYIKLHDW